jgi:hypothetical protein
MVLQELQRENESSPTFSAPIKAAVGIGNCSSRGVQAREVRGGMSVTSLSPSQKAASPTFTEVWQRENEKPESPFDSALFSSSLYPADGAGDTGPQPSPLPPKPKALFYFWLAVAAA